VDDETFDPKPRVTSLPTMDDDRYEDVKMTQDQMPVCVTSPRDDSLTLIADLEHAIFHISLPSGGHIWQPSP
jgi:hypothetical protein